MTFTTAQRHRELQIVPRPFLPGATSPGLERELEIVAKLHRLAQVSWSPTLRANSHLLKRRLVELQRSKVETKGPRT